MKEFLDILIPSGREIYYTFLAVAIPFMLSKIIEKVKEAGNPAWKQQSEVQEEGEG
jgi:hypothetical protein